MALIRSGQWPKRHRLGEKQDQQATGPEGNLRKKAMRPGSQDYDPKA